MDFLKLDLLDHCLVLIRGGKAAHPLPPDPLSGFGEAVKHKAFMIRLEAPTTFHEIKAPALPNTLTKKPKAKPWTRRQDVASKWAWWSQRRVLGVSHCKPGRVEGLGPSMFFFT